MYEVHFIIDGDPYKALFLNADEVLQFMSDVSSDGSHIFIKSSRLRNPKEVLNERAYEWAYLVELCALALFPEMSGLMEKTWHCEAVLREAGLL